MGDACKRNLRLYLIRSGAWNSALGCLLTVSRPVFAQSHLSPKRQHGERSFLRASKTFNADVGFGLSGVLVLLTGSGELLSRFDGPPSTTAITCISLGYCTPISESHKSEQTPETSRLTPGERVQATISLNQTALVFLCQCIKWHALRAESIMHRQGYAGQRDVYRAKGKKGTFSKITPFRYAAVRSPKGEKREKIPDWASAARAGLKRN